jgi:hypothetical protein
MIMSDNVKKRGVIYCTHEEGRTAQEFKSECDIHNVLKRIMTTRVDDFAGRHPVYGDFSNRPTLQEASNVTTAAMSMFYDMSDPIRAEVGHSPRKFVSWLKDPRNRERAIELGFLVPQRLAAPKTDDKPSVTQNKSVVENSKSSSE